MKGGAASARCRDTRSMCRRPRPQGQGRQSQANASYGRAYQTLACALFPPGRACPSRSVRPAFNLGSFLLVRECLPVPGWYVAEDILHGRQGLHERRVNVLASAVRTHLRRRHGFVLELHLTIVTQEPIHILVAPTTSSAHTASPPPPSRAPAGP